VLPGKWNARLEAIKMISVNASWRAHRRPCPLLIAPFLHPFLHHYRALVLLGARVHLLHI
jgi:hypothetical protein